MKGSVQMHHLKQISLLLTPLEKRSRQYHKNKPKLRPNNMLFSVTQRKPTT